jgi:ElaB/YqjD/DUF883 family membrane-anchored ribosome-binding protein
MADEQEPEMIRRQMEAQRTSLGEKLETLENKIVRTVEGAREAALDTVHTVKDSVHSSVETVKETVESSVESVKEALDLKRQVERHPWTMIGGAIAVGFAAGWLLNRFEERLRPTASGKPSPSAGTPSLSATSPSPGEQAAPASRLGVYPGMAPLSPAAPPVSMPQERETWADRLSQTLAPELNKLKGLAIGTLMGVIRDLVTESMPDPMRSKLNEVVNDITCKLGGEPIESKVLHNLLPRPHDAAQQPQHEAQEDGHCSVAQDIGL